MGGLSSLYIFLVNSWRLGWFKDVVQNTFPFNARVRIVFIIESTNNLVINTEHFSLKGIAVISFLS